ncbi:MAG TPA: PH domain-containing protein [Acidimicrobiales bacterium]|nr:PH domain-containing protein [Acidimicrobiales bacterium]
MASPTESFEAGLSWGHPSPKLRSLRRLEVAAIFVPLILVTAVPSAVSGSAVAAAVVAGVLVVAGLVMDWMLGRRVRAWAYTERAEDLIVSRGLMFRRMSVVPYGRMQFVDVTAGPLERIFGLATVRLHTAAAASDARIPGLDANDAARLRDQLASLGESHLAGL